MRGLEEEPHLPPGYRLDRSDPDLWALCRPEGWVVAHFSIRGATKEAIDGIMKLGMNHPMGPLQLADFIGLDTCLAILRVLHDGLGDPKYRPCPLLVQMVDAGKLDEAEHAAHDLIDRFPHLHDGYHRLGMVHQARGDHLKAAECYRKAVVVIREHPDDYDPGFEAAFQTLADRLDPSTTEG